MSWDGPDQFLELWQSDSEEARFLIKKFFLDGLDYIVQAKSNSFSRIKQGESISHLEARWFEEQGYPSYFDAQLTTDGSGVRTLTFTGDLFGAPVNAENLSRCMRNGTIFEKDDGGGQVYIVDATGLQGSAPFTAEVANFGNTNPADDSGAVEYARIAELVNDRTPFSNPRSLTRWTRRVGTQLFVDNFQIDFTRKLIQYEQISSEPEHQIQRLIENLHTRLSYAVLRGKNTFVAGEPVFGLQNQQPTMCGIFSWPEILQAEQANPKVYINKASQELMRNDIENLIRDLWLTEHAEYGVGDWCLVGHPTQTSLIANFDDVVLKVEREDDTTGRFVNVFQSKTTGEKFPILSDRYMRKDVLGLVDFSQCSWGYLAGDEFNRKIVATDDWTEKTAVRFQTYGCVVRSPRKSIGMMYGLPQVDE